MLVQLTIKSRNGTLDAFRSRAQYHSPVFRALRKTNGAGAILISEEKIFTEEELLQSSG